MAVDFYLGIDGGGTTTRARLTDLAGITLGEGRSGSSNLTMGIATAVESVLAASHAALHEAGLDPSHFGAIAAGLGLAGANVPSLTIEFQEQRLPFAHVSIASDAVIACLGAHGGEDGAILILGTGSQGLVMTAGTVATVGGWGFELSDEGSGAVLGRAAVRAAILAFDRLGPTSSMTATILARFGDDPAMAAVWGKTAAPSDYGALAPLVFHQFADGDPVAIAVVKQATTAVESMLDRLIGLGAQSIALMGGLADQYQPLLRSDLQARLVLPKSDALGGALALARRNAPGSMIERCAD